MNRKSSSQELGSTSLPDRIEKIYYSHGVFCSSHPVPVITFACFVILLCCSPLINLPLPGNAPQEHTTPATTYIVPENISRTTEIDEIPQWGFPVGYVLQVTVRTAVSPWHSDLITTDAFRTPLQQVFEIVETIKNYQYFTKNKSSTLEDYCLHVAESDHQRVSSDFLPHYGCLVLSPAYLWKHDLNRFIADADILGTIFSTQISSVQTSPSLKDILFGVPWKETNIQRFFLKPRQKIITYAITIILQQYNIEFLKGLENRLHDVYQFPDQNATFSSGNITHVHFHNHYSLIEFIPLLVTYIILFLYIYFSVRKIELVKSKIGMAFSAVVTVIASLCMSVGICTWFGLSFHLNAGEVYLKEIFPYVVVIIGLENILVLTKSVVSTPVHLDVKVRVAQGLSKEGWSITKNLCTELVILTFGFLTFVPSIQEFCLFAVVGLLCDFFLQLVFFATILSIDVRRMELSDLHKQSVQQGVQTPTSEQLSHMYPLFRCPVMSGSRPYLQKSRSSSRLNAAGSAPSSPNLQTQPRVVTAQYKGPILVKLPKRLRLVFFWARCRIFQRAFMLTFVIWLLLIAYKSGVVEHFRQPIGNVSPAVKQEGVSEEPVQTSTHPLPPAVTNYVSVTQQQPKEMVPLLLKKGIVHPNMKGQIAKLQPKDTELWRNLNHYHWPTAFSFFNLTVRGRYISILPSIHLSIPIDPSYAIQHRHPQEVEIPTLFAVDRPEGDSLDYTADDSDDEHRLYPSSPSEFILAIILAIPSLVFMVYFMIVLYRCICTRNYAEWRSSWSQEPNQCQGDLYTQLVLEAMPIVLEGHPQEVECLTTDGALVVSSCLAGQLRVWDSSSGECLTVIDRRKGIYRQRFKTEHDLDDVEDIGSDYESGSPPSHSEFMLEQVRKRLSAPPILCDEFESRKSTNSAHSIPDTTLSDEKGRRDVSLSDSTINTSTTNELDFLESGKIIEKKKKFKHEPDLSGTIKTDFADYKSIKLSQREQILRRCDSSRGFDFSHFDGFYIEHKQLIESEEQEECKRNQINTATDKATLSLSLGEIHSQNIEICTSEESTFQGVFSPVWCLDCQDNLIAAGCSDGRIEFWDGLSGILKCVYEDGSGLGVTGVHIVGNRVVAARLHGALDFLELRPSRSEVHHHHHHHHHRAFDVASMHRRTHIRQGSGSSIGQDSLLSWDEDLYCVWVQTARAHQQPITVLQVEGSRAVTGSQDHSLKVFRVEDAMCQLTLHGHHGPITALFIDKLSPMTAASGAQDGAVCLWDLLTGACICRLQGHDGAVAAVTYTAAYVLSAGVDAHLIVWERFQGHLLNTINLGTLVVWDIRVGEPARIVRLGHSDLSTFVRQIQHVGNAIVCDYGNQLRVVQFPTVVEKAD